MASTTTTHREAGAEIAACPPTRSPTRTSTRAGSAATGRPRSSTSPRTRASGARTSREFERTAALWNYCLFFWGEDAVADNLSPYIDAAPREEQKYFLTTQQVDEARHAVFFKRFMHEVCGIGDGSDGERPAGDQAAADVGLPQDLRPPRHDGRRAARRPLAGEARGRGHALPRRDRGGLAQPGQHFICSYLEERDQLPAFRAGDGEHRRRRAAPHRLRRQAARRPQSRRPRRRAEGGGRGCCATSPATPHRC